MNEYEYDLKHQTLYLTLEKQKNLYMWKADKYYLDFYNLVSLTAAKLKKKSATQFIIFYSATIRSIQLQKQNKFYESCYRQQFRLNYVLQMVLDELLKVIIFGQLLNFLNTLLICQFKTFKKKNLLSIYWIVHRKTKHSKNLTKINK